jgi:hypothetical protein
MDIMFDGIAVELPPGEDPITMGVTSGYDFFGWHAMYVEGFAQDSTCSNSMRRLTDRESVKHLGHVGDLNTWWEQVLGQVGIVADDPRTFIEDAQNITVDFRDVRFDLAEFYTPLDSRSTSRSGPRATLAPRQPIRSRSICGRCIRRRRTHSPLFQRAGRSVTRQLRPDGE